MIYILEDDLNIRKLITYTLNKEGFKVLDFAKPSDFYKALEKELPDLCLLDIMLPEEDGLSILRRLKHDAKYKNIPVILLTAKTSEYDKVLGLDDGADDYVAKPFGIMELLARIRAVLRRYQVLKESEVYTYKDLSLDVLRHEVRYKDELITLTRKEFDILAILLGKIGICHTRDELLNQVWGYDYDDTTRTVDVHIRTLRQKLGEAGEYIQTVRGVGYKIGE